MKTTDEKFDAGLENVIAAQTVLSEVDGEGGRLIIRGYDVADLVERFDFENAAALLWAGFFAPACGAETLHRRLAEARVAAFERGIDQFAAFARLGDAEGVRAALALCADGASQTDAINLTAMIAVATGAVARLRAGQAPLPPDPSLPHAADLLRMLRGADVNPAEARALEIYLIAASDHGLNASTFVARAVASTRAGLCSSVVAAFSALKGPLHGGAPGPVLDMLDAIGSPTNADAWIKQALVRGDRLMGFGHRIYRARDPRADVLRQVAAGLPRTAGRLASAQAIEQKILDRLSAEKPERRLETNVEYYTAILLEALGAPRASFTSLFACGRILGWIAHAREQAAAQRLVRPASIYVGPRPAQAA